MRMPWYTMACYVRVSIGGHRQQFSREELHSLEESASTEYSTRTSLLLYNAVCSVVKGACADRQKCPTERPRREPP